MAQTPDEAYDFLHERVHVPAFFEKLASDHGIRPRSQEEAVDFLLMSEKLRVLYDQEQAKTAGSKSTKLQKMAAKLDQQLASAGIVAPAPQIKQAAKRAAADPKIVEAVLSLQTAAAHAQSQTPATAAA